MKKVYILGGGTFSHVRNHLAIAAPAFGGTARYLHTLIPGSTLILTKMADPASNIVTNQDVAAYVDQILADPDTNAIIFNMALCDFDGTIDDVPSGPHAQRLKTMHGDVTMHLTPAEKVIGRIHDTRPDISVVGFKTTTNASIQEQIKAGRNLMLKNQLTLVLANDTTYRRNILITQDGYYFEDMSQEETKSSGKDRNRMLVTLASVLR